MNKFFFATLLFALGLLHPSFAQKKDPIPLNDANTPLHLLQPNYPIPYTPPTIEAVTKTLHHIHSYLDTVTPPLLINEQKGTLVEDPSQIDSNTILKKGDYRLVSYEWGVVYGAMLLATEATGDIRFKKYAFDRLQFLADAAPQFKKQTIARAETKTKTPLHNLLFPHALDDCGAMCAAMIKSLRSGSKANMRGLIDDHIDYILHREHRLTDGTLARMRPQSNTIWLDDLFMSVPALAQMGKLTGDPKYYDEACKQVLAFSARMFNKEKGLFMHGWVEGMTEHPQFHWARANGWAIMTMVELLDILPENHPKRNEILTLLKAHAKGLAACQSNSGFWHQLLDRSDSYLETSATAIYTFSFARAINRGWIDPIAYSPATLLAWNAVSTKVNNQGQVEGTCVGTGMGFDPAFYEYRPISPYAAHGYGPTILAGAEIIQLLKTHTFEINDSALQIKR